MSAGCDCLIAHSIIRSPQSPAAAQVFGEKMNLLSDRELEMANLIVEALNLEEVKASDIEPDAPLYGDGLGLDSIDILEISLAISKRYGVQLKADDADNVKIFRSLRALTEHIEARRTK